jgi:hypothetical protein
VESAATGRVQAQSFEQSAREIEGGPPDDETAEVKRKVVEYQTELKDAPDSTKQPIRLKHDANSKVLQVLSGKDPQKYTLYIVGHCAPGSDSLLR